jgi:5-methylcytosine-specific restriction endonuclease McrA
MTKRVLLASVLLAVIATVAIARDRSVAVQFQRMNPCPATGERYGACPGWERDHVVPLCAGGADATWNMQWLSVADHKAKTRVDVKDCAALRKNCMFMFCPK